MASTKMSTFFKRFLSTKGENTSDELALLGLPRRVCVTWCRCLIFRSISISATFPWVAFFRMQQVVGASKLTPGVGAWVKWWPLQHVLPSLATLNELHLQLFPNPAQICAIRTDTHRGRNNRKAPRQSLVNLKKNQTYQENSEDCAVTFNLTTVMLCFLILELLVLCALFRS